MRPSGAMGEFAESLIMGGALFGAPIFLIDQRLQVAVGGCPRLLDGGFHQLAERLVIRVGGVLVNGSFAFSSRAGKRSGKEAALRGLMQVDPVQACDFLGLVAVGAAALVDRRDALQQAFVAREVIGRLSGRLLTNASW